MTSDAAVLAMVAPTTEVGVRALGYATDAREQALAYFSGLMGSELESEFCAAARIVRCLQRRAEPQLSDWRWLGVLSKSHDEVRARMAETALGVLLDSGPI